MGETIPEIPAYLRPYEKALEKGPAVLDDAELLAVMLKTGTGGLSSVSLCRNLLAEAGGTLAGLRAMPVQELMKIRGIGRVKAVQILCLSELAVRFSRSELPKPPDLSSCAYVAAYYMEEMRVLRQESLRALYLNTKNRLIREAEISRGSVNASMLPVREILVEGFRAEAVNLILIHNHPSGDPSPSRGDIEGTLEMKKAGDLVGITLLDHVIIGDHRYVSLGEQGYLA